MSQSLPSQNERAFPVSVYLDERDVSVLKWAVPMIRGIEGEYPDIAGIREGEAMSDVLAAIHSRAEREMTGRPAPITGHVPPRPLWQRLLRIRP